MYAKISNNQVVNYPVNIYAELPHVSFPVGWEGGIVEGEEFALITPVAYPEVPHTKTVSEGTPEFVSGQWQQVWVVTDASASVVASRVAEKWTQVRQQRNSLLQSCDWTQLADCPLSSAVKLQWQAYRQDLRDITEQSNPFSLTWPTAPAA